MYFCSSHHTVPSTIERQKHALRQTQTSRTKACSQVHMIQVHMTSSSLYQVCCFVFGETPTLNSLPPAVHLRTGFIQTRAYSVEVKCRRTMMAANSITSSVVMIFPTLDLHAVRSRLYKSCPEMDSGREFRVGVSPKTKWHRLEEVMCTWIMCTWEQALVREVCVCRKACFCRSIVLGTV